MSDPVKETIECYEARAKDYAQEHLDPAVVEELLEYFIGHLYGLKILDVGCGPGWDAKYFTDHGFGVIGIDPVEEFLEIARKVAPKATFLKMDMRVLDFPPESFDGLWACASFLHIPRKEALRTLRGFRKVLKPNGLLYLSVKEGERESWRFYGGGCRSFITYYHIDELVRLVSKAGFEVFRVRRDPKHEVFIDLFARPKK